jgi:quercetin dioxygenase-like cupin family protein
MGTKTVKINPEHLDWENVEGFPGVRLKILYIDDESGQVYQLWETTAEECIEPRHTHRKGGHSFYMIRGDTFDANTGEVVVPQGGFWYAPRGDVHGPFKYHQGALTLLVADCQLDFEVVGE